MNETLWEGRVLAWFSCGAPSAVNAKLVVEKYGDRAVVINCDTTADEHPDNFRFFMDVQRWLGVSIVRIHSDKFRDVDDVYQRTRYMSGINGARCTTELKKVPRFAFQDVADIHTFGYTADEERRIRRFEKENPELFCEWLLLDAGIEKDDCFDVVREAGIALPKMYELGFKNNNCLGCVKATSPKYWNLVRRVDPMTFLRRAVRSRDLGVRLVRYKGERIFLDELPDVETDEPMPDISCGPQCESAAGGI